MTCRSVADAYIFKPIAIVLCYLQHSKRINLGLILTVYLKVIVTKLRTVEGVPYLYK